MIEPGHRSLRRSFGDALRGVWDAVKSERNMRIHLAACGYVLFFAWRLELSRGEVACLLLAIGMVLGAELFNTSVEKLCDFTEKHRNPHIRVVKDMAAGAVFLCAVFAALVGIVIFARPEFWQLLYEMAATPLYLVLLLISAVAALVFINVNKLRK